MSKKPTLEPPADLYEQERQPSDPVRYVTRGSQNGAVPTVVPQFNAQTNDLLDYHNRELAPNMFSSSQ